MTTAMLTTAGHMCHAGDARAVAGIQGAYGHPSSIGTEATFAQPTAPAVVFDRKNWLTTRQPSELSP